MSCQRWVATPTIIAETFCEVSSILWVIRPFVVDTENILEKNLFQTPLFAKSGGSFLTEAVFLALIRILSIFSIGVEDVLFFKTLVD